MPNRHYASVVRASGGLRGLASRYGGEGEEGAMRNALFFPLSRHWPERVGVRVARATHPRLRGNDGREPKGEVGRGHGGVYNYPAMRPRVGRNSGSTSEAGR